MAFEVEVFTKNMELTDRIQDYVNKKVGKLDRYLPDIDEARVDLSYVKSARSSTDRQVAQITIRGKGFILRAEERANDVFTAMDTALEKMERQIERYKGKRNRGRGDGRSAAEAVAAQPVEEEDSDAIPIIVRRKSFRLQPMNELEAIEQMALLGHENFYIFFNPDTKGINILYRRRDGNYGLIEPVYG